MGLFSKKSDNSFEKLPELPQLPKSVITPAQVQTSALPAMPRSESANRWSMQAVKDAVKSQDNYSDSNNYSDNNDISSGEREVNERVELMPRSRSTYPTQQAPLRREPLFVRIDKFESALRDFDEISVKIRKIDDLISEIRTLREKEDREFSEWEKDLHTIRSRLDNIDRTLFSQLD